MDIVRQSSFLFKPFMKLYVFFARFLCPFSLFIFFVLILNFIIFAAVWCFNLKLH